MYGNYTTASNARDDPECATYPKSGGRTGGSTLFNKRWGHRLNGKCKPIPMTWDDDDDDDEAPQPANGWEEFRNSLATMDNNKSGSEEEHYQKSWRDDSHPDSVHEISYEQNRNNPHSGYFFEQRHKYMDNTYPTTRPVIGGGCHHFSAFAEAEEDKIEATPLQPPMHSLAKTEVKQRKDQWIDGFLSKTPLPERFQAANNSNLLGDSGISLTTAKSLLTDDDKKSDSKTSSRSLFTPSLSRNVQFNIHDLLGPALSSWNKSSEVEEVDSKKSLMGNMNGLSTPLCNKLPLRNQHFQNDETPLKNVPIEKADIFKVQKSEKKLGGNKSHIANIFSEDNKENFSYGMQFVSSTTDLAQENEIEEKKLSRSQSHASVLRVDNENVITPSKEERSLSTNSSAKSLTNLFHPGGPQGVHASRIPTPIRLHTPLKQNPLISTSAAGTQPKMSEPEMPMKFTHSPNENDATSAMHPPKPPVAIAAKQGEVPLQFGSTPVIHSILPSNNIFTTQMNKAPAQSSFGNGWSLGSSTKSHLNGGSFHDLATFSGGVSHVNDIQESKFSSDSQQILHYNMLQHIKISANDKIPDGFVKPNNVDALVSRNKDDYLGIIHTGGSNDSTGPPSFAQPTFNPPSSQASNLSRKPFSLRPSAFEAPQIKSDLFHNTQSNPAPTSFSSSSQINSINGQPPYTITVESNLQASHGKFSGPFSQSQAPLSRVSSCASTPLSNSNLTCSSTVNQQIAQTQISHQPVHGLFVTPQMENYSLNPEQGQALASQMNNQPQPLNNSAIKSLANTQTADSSSSVPVVQDFAVPEAVKIKPQERDASSVAVVRPTSVQSNRKILMVNKKCYEVLRMLGKGASSKVYDVLDCQTNKCVAVKRVELRQGDAMVEGYLKEVDLLNQLQGSDYIIKLIDSEVRHDRGYKVLYMVMERGEMDLSTSIKLMSASKTPLMPSSGFPGSKIPIVTVIYYWVSMLNAVDEIHRKGIVHSDLKPANFLLVGGQLKLIDFGIATAVQTDMTSVVKDDPAGTPNYMSPEAIGLCVNGSPNSEDTFKSPKASYKSDVWSLGCILYSLMYGRSPFQHITNERIKLDAIRNHNYLIPFPTNTSVHPPLLRALKRCLVRDYKQRASIAELKAIDYLQSSDLDEEVWDTWKDSAAKKILNAVSPECKMQVLKVIQEVFKSPPKRKEES